MLNHVTEEDVRNKRYLNSDKVPEVGDVVIVNGQELIVGQLGGVMPMFHNCAFDDVFVLTNPEELELKK